VTHHPRCAPYGASTCYDRERDRGGDIAKIKETDEEILIVILSKIFTEIMAEKIIADILAEM
jgi:hypothetical protein